MATTKQLPELPENRSKACISEAIKPGLWLHVMPTQLTKSLSFGFSVTVPRNRRSNAHLTLLRRCLARATRSHPSLQSLAQACDDLHGANIRLQLSNYGAVQTLGASFTMPSLAFVGGGFRAFNRFRDIALEMLLDVDSCSPGLTKARIDAERMQVMRMILALKDNKPLYASLRARQIAFRHRPIGLPEWGDEIELSRAKQESLLETWDRCVSKGRVDVWLSGHGITDTIIDSLRQPLEAWPRQKLLRVSKLRCEDFEEDLISFRDPTDGVQGYAVLGFTTGSQLGDPDYAALRVANACLGGLTTSRLFQRIRERLGLAYAVGSSIDSSTGLGECSAGCDRGKTAKVLDHMFKEFEKLRCDGIREQELREGVESTINGLLSASDSVHFFLARKFLALLTGKEVDFESELQTLRNLRVDDVNGILSRLQPYVRYQLA